MRQVIAFFIGCCFPVLLLAQQADTTIVKDTALVKTDSASILTDSIVPAKDTIITVKQGPSKTYFSVLKSLLKDNQYLNSSGRPVAMIMSERVNTSDDLLFYMLAGVIAVLAFFRFFYTRYFNTLFRVFFNTSLRQSQLTDQLLQAKLPSLFFNVLFIIAGGLYTYFLLRFFNWINASNTLIAIFYCAVSLALIYIVKYITLKFTGWITGLKEVTNTYVFIIFLINKILGILLIPFTVIMAFSSPQLVKIAAILSLLLVGLMFLLRFFRSYGLLQHQLKISRFHFFMYIAGIEIVPLLLIYKALVYFIK